jgi:hypothetical protein
VIFKRLNLLLIVVDTTQIRNRLFIQLVGFTPTVMTYLSFRQYKSVGFTREYIILNILTFYLLIGGVLVIRLSTKSHRFEVISEFFLAFCLSISVVFFYHVTDPVLAGLAFVAIGVGMGVTESFSRAFGKGAASFVVGFKASFVFVSLFIYIPNKLFSTGDFLLAPPLVVYTIIFAVLTNGLLTVIRN